MPGKCRNDSFRTRHWKHCRQCRPEKTNDDETNYRQKAHGTAWFTDKIRFRWEFKVTDVSFPLESFQNAQNTKKQTRDCFSFPLPFFDPVVHLLLLRREQFGSNWLIKTWNWFQGLGPSFLLSLDRRRSRASVLVFLDVRPSFESHQESGHINWRQYELRERAGSQSNVKERNRRPKWSTLGPTVARTPPDNGKKSLASP